MDLFPLSCLDPRRVPESGPIMQAMYYAGEVREFGAITESDGVRAIPEEFELATGLMDKLFSPNLRPVLQK